MAAARGRNIRNGSVFSSSIDWVATLSDPQNHDSPGKPAISTLHWLARGADNQEIWLVLLDTSGSLLTNKAIAKAKGALVDICRQAYASRQILELVGFGNDGITTLQSARKPSRDMRPLLERIGSGGGTPLRRALQLAANRLEQLARKNPEQVRRLVILTDARSRDETRDIALRADVFVIDTEQSSVRLGRARKLATQMNARYQHIDQLALR
ncbi:MAG: VWA domain-containing protein [Pseudomonadota bacterium]